MWWLRQGRLPAYESAGREVVKAFKLQEECAIINRCFLYKSHNENKWAAMSWKKGLSHRYQLKAIIFKQRRTINLYVSVFRKLGRASWAPPRQSIYRGLSPRIWISCWIFDKVIALFLIVGITGKIWGSQGGAPRYTILVQLPRLYFLYSAEENQFLPFFLI